MQIFALHNSTVCVVCMCTAQCTSYQTFRSFFIIKKATTQCNELHFIWLSIWLPRCLLKMAIYIQWALFEEYKYAQYLMYNQRLEMAVDNYRLAVDVPKQALYIDSFFLEKSIWIGIRLNCCFTLKCIAELYTKNTNTGPRKNTSIYQWFVKMTEPKKEKKNRRYEEVRSVLHTHMCGIRKVATKNTRSPTIFDYITINRSAIFNCGIKSKAITLIYLISWNKSNNRQCRHIVPYADDIVLSAVAQLCAYFASFFPVSFVQFFLRSRIADIWVNVCNWEWSSFACKFLSIVSAVDLILVRSP